MPKAHPLLFHYYYNDKLQHIIVIHVDDFPWSENKHSFKNVISKVFGKFIVGKNDTAFRYLGLDLKEHEK